MSRGTTAAAVVAATGALVAASVLSVVAISSAASTEEPVGSPPAAPLAAAPTVPSAGEGSAVTADDLRPAGSDEDLRVPTIATPRPAAPSAASTASTASTQTVSLRSATTDTRLDVGRARAKAAVLQAAPGRVERVSVTKRGGYTAYAVQVQRTDGSVLVGYVSRTTGVVFDWAQVSRAAGTATTSASSHGSSVDSEDDSDSQEASDDRRESASDDDGQDESNGHDGSDGHESEGSDD